MPFNRLTKLSVVIPMRNERDNAASLIHEIDAALAGEAHGFYWRAGKCAR